MSGLGKQVSVAPDMAFCSPRWTVSLSSPCPWFCPVKPTIPSRTRWQQILTWSPTCDLSPLNLSEIPTFIMMPSWDLYTFVNLHHLHSCLHLYSYSNKHFKCRSFGLAQGFILQSGRYMDSGVRKAWLESKAICFSTLRYSVLRCIKWICNNDNLYSYWEEQMK